MQFLGKTKLVIENHHNHHRPIIQHNRALENLNIQHNRVPLIEFSNSETNFFLGRPVVIKLVVDDNGEEQGDGDDEDDQGDDDEGNTNDPLHVVVEAVCLIPAVAPVWVVAHLSF